MISDFIKNLQSKPYKTRVRILWSSVGVIALALVAIWGLSVKNTIEGIDGNNFVVEDLPAIISNTEYIKVERAEIKENVVSIHFNIKNPTNDILSFSRLNDISLVADGTTISPKSLTDRQGNPFVQKILSQTQNFGIVEFETSEDSGELIFNNLFFEQSEKNIFSEKIELDFEQLKKDQEVRS